MKHSAFFSRLLSTQALRLASLSLLAFSTSVAAAPPVPTLSTPYNGATNVSKSNVKFSWSSAGATNYRLVISQNSSFSGFRDLNGSSTCDSTCFTTATSSTSYYKNMDLAGKTYYWKVRANNSTGASSFSGYRYFTTAGSALSAKVDAFVNTWNGRGTDFDGVYGYQCVDLMRRYAQDVLGLSNGGRSELPTGSDKSAYSIFTNASSSRFTRIYNSLTAVPQKGDIIFWKKSSSNGNYGHVAIFIQGDARSFTSIDQNWGAGANTTTGLPAKIVPHDYTSSGGVVGWLRLK